MNPQGPPPVTTHSHPRSLSKDIPDEGIPPTAIPENHPLSTTANSDSTPHPAHPWCSPTSAPHPHISPPPANPKPDAASSPMSHPPRTPSTQMGTIRAPSPPPRTPRTTRVPRNAPSPRAMSHHLSEGPGISGGPGTLSTHLHPLKRRTPLHTRPDHLPSTPLEKNTSRSRRTYHLQNRNPCQHHIPMTHHTRPPQTWTSFRAHPLPPPRDTPPRNVLGQEHKGQADTGHTTSMPTPSTDHTRIQPHPAPPPNMPLKVHAGPKGHIHSHRRPPKRPHHHTPWVSKPLPVGNLTTAPPPPLIPEPMTAPPTAPARDNPLSHLKEQVGADHVLPAPTCSTPQGRITSTRKPQGTPPQHRKGHRRTHPITPLLPITPQQHRVKQEPPKSPRRRATPAPEPIPPRRGGHPPHGHHSIFPHHAFGCLQRMTIPV